MRPSLLMVEMKTRRQMTKRRHRHTLWPNHASPLLACLAPGSCTGCNRQCDPYRPRSTHSRRLCADDCPWNLVSRCSTCGTYHRLTVVVRFIEHFSPYCSHCRHFAPTWGELVEDFKAHEETGINLAQVNCATHGGQYCSPTGIASD
jgi:hypothetical protein